VRHQRPVCGHTGEACGDVADNGDPPVRSCVDTGHHGAQPNDARRQRTGQQVDQAGPVERVVRRSELPFGYGGERLFCQYAAVFPPQQPDGIGPESHFLQ
jgi:hypothetical protein